MIMAMLTQAFRYAYEPFVFGKSRDKDSMEEIHKFSTWQKVFDEIGGTYERVWSKEELDQGYLNN